MNVKRTFLVVNELIVVSVICMSYQWSNFQQFRFKTCHLSSDWKRKNCNFQLLWNILFLIISFLKHFKFKFDFWMNFLRTQKMMLDFNRLCDPKNCSNLSKTPSEKLQQFYLNWKPLNSAKKRRKRHKHLYIEFSIYFLKFEPSTLLNDRTITIKRKDP